MCLHPKNWNLFGKPLYPSLTFTQERSFQWKHSFFIVALFYLCKATFLKISRLKLLKLLKSCLPNEKPYEMNMKLNSTSLWVLFSKIPAERFTSRWTWISRFQVLTRINWQKCCSTMADHLITNHQVDYLFLSTHPGWNFWKCMR